MTILELKHSFTGLKIGVCGDLLNGRTVHSLLRALCDMGRNTYYLISTPELKLPEYIFTALIASGSIVYEVATIDECISELDVIYMTRIQRERFKSYEQYEKQAGIYILDKNKLKSAKKDLIILHPLPKVDEIEYTIDDDPRAKYFLQAENGMYVRMALVLKFLEYSKKPINSVYSLPNVRFCSNPRCITNHERYLPEKFMSKNNIKCCAYCEHEV